MKVTVTNPQFPDDYEFVIAGLVVAFPNGKPVELSSEDLAAYEAFHGHKFVDAVKNTPNISLASAKGGE